MEKLFKIEIGIWVVQVLRIFGKPPQRQSPSGLLRPSAIEHVREAREVQLNIPAVNNASRLKRVEYYLMPEPGQANGNQEASNLPLRPASGFRTMGEQVTSKVASGYLCL